MAAETWRSYPFSLLVWNGLALAPPVSQVPFGDAPKDALKPMTVCEVLQNPRKFVGQDIAVVGRADSDELALAGLLTEDHCQPLRTGAFVWPSRIWIDCCDPF